MSTYHAGTGLNAEGLPDIAWCAEIPPGDYLVSRYKQKSFYYGDEEPFTLRHAFRLARYPITKVQFQVFMQDKSVHKDTPPHVLSPGEPDEACGAVWWSDSFIYCRWLNQKYHEAGLLADDWVIDVPTEIEWEIMARRPDIQNMGQAYRLMKRPPSIVGTYEEAYNPVTGMYIVPDIFREWCWKYTWHNREGYDALVDTMVGDHNNLFLEWKYLIPRGIESRLRWDIMPSYGQDIGLRVVCRPAHLLARS